MKFMDDEIKKFKKIIAFIFILFIILLTIIIFYFFWFIPLGYRISAPIHGFLELSERVYVEKEWAGDKEHLTMVIDEAKQRVNGFFGEVKSCPVIIVCDNSSKLKRLGGDHDTMTFMLKGVYSYISVSSEFLSVDVLAHELTHAETHNRIYKGKMSSSIPIWFDEGIAIQNDYRENYSYKTWLEITNDGKEVPKISEYDTVEEFFAGTTEDRRKRYCLAGHKISEWLAKNGIEGLLNLLNDISEGKEFSYVYQ